MQNDLFCIQNFRMIQIVVSDEMHRLCPEFVGVAIAARVENSLYSPELWKWIDNFSSEYRIRYTFDSIKMIPAVRATREAYKYVVKIRVVIALPEKHFVDVYYEGSHYIK